MDAVVKSREAESENIVKIREESNTRNVEDGDQIKWQKDENKPRIRG